MQSIISDRPGVLTDEQVFTPWKSPDMEGANPADVLTVCHSTNSPQTTIIVIRGITNTKSCSG